jgi:hypothetical protein
VKDRYSSYPQFISVAASNSTLIHLLILWKDSKRFPQQNACAKGPFIDYVLWSVISRTKCRTLWLSICWRSEQESLGPTLRRLKSALRFSGKGNETQDQAKRLLNDTISVWILSF